MDIYQEIVGLRQAGRRGALATITNVRGSIPSFQTSKMLVRDDGSIVGTIGGGCVEAVRLANEGSRKAGIGLDPDPSLVLAATPEANLLKTSDVLLAELEILLEDHITQAS